MVTIALFDSAILARIENMRLPSKGGVPTLDSGSTKRRDGESVTSLAA